MCKQIVVNVYPLCSIHNVVINVWPMWLCAIQNVAIVNISFYCGQCLLQQTTKDFSIISNKNIIALKFCCEFSTWDDTNFSWVRKLLIWAEWGFSINPETKWEEVVWINYTRVTRFFDVRVHFITQYLSNRVILKPYIRTPDTTKS